MQMKTTANMYSLALLLLLTQDVLFGRGVTITAHPGNKRLRSIVQAQKPAFVKVKKSEKRNVARGIVDMIENLDPPGRFLMEDPNFRDVGKNGSLADKVWMPVESKDKVVDKVMHRLREKDGATSGDGDAAPLSSSMSLNSARDMAMR